MSKTVIREMLANAADYIVVNDGSGQYPVDRSDLRDGDTERTIRDMGAAEYAEFCRSVPADLRVASVGDDLMTRLTDAMIERGAEYWRVG